MEKEIEKLLRKIEEYTSGVKRGSYARKMKSIIGEIKSMRKDINFEGQNLECLMWKASVLEDGGFVPENCRCHLCIRRNDEDN